MIDRTTVIFSISIVGIAISLASYPYISALITNQRQEQVLNATGLIIDEMDKQNEYLLSGFTNITEIIIENQELIKNNTGTNLNMTLHNRAMLDDTNNIQHVLLEILQLNDTDKAMDILNLTHNDSKLMQILNNTLYHKKQ